MGEHMLRKFQEKNLIKAGGKNLIFSALLGAIFFYVLIGAKILDPHYIDWLSAGDPLQHYLGWELFRKDAWHFPIGLNPDAGLAISSSIVFSDSIPLFAFVFKLLTKNIDGIFQYFGLWILLCFVMQAIVSWKIVEIFTNNFLIKIFAVSIFIVSPPMIWRVGLHDALSGHFLLISAIYLCISRNINQKKILWTALLVISVLIHFYFFAMILAIWMASCLDDCCSQGWPALNNFSRQYALLPLIILFVMWQAGYFIGAQAGEWGYGTFHFNPMSLFDPNGWSYIISPFNLNEVDSFHYLGLGVIALGIFVIPKLLLNPYPIKAVFKRHPFLFACLLAFLLFSMSNIIQIGVYKFQFNLPNYINRYAEIFRASSRFFWPIYYCIYIIFFYIVIRSYKTKSAILILGLSFFLQLIDTSSGWMLVKNRVNNPQQGFELLHSKFWETASKRYRSLVMVPYEKEPQNWQQFGRVASAYFWPTNAIYLARVTPDGIANANRSFLFGGKNSSSVYVFSPEYIPIALSFFEPLEDLMESIDGFYTVALKWNLMDYPKNSLNSNSTTINPFHESLYSKPMTSLFMGWGNKENWGTWSSGEFSVIVLPIPQNNSNELQISLRALVNKSHPIQEVEIWINGEKWKNISLDEFSQNLISIPLDKGFLNRPYITIGFKYLNPVRPVDIGFAEDNRLLAVGLISTNFIRR